MDSCGVRAFTSSTHHLRSSWGSPPPSEGFLEEVQSLIWVIVDAELPIQQSVLLFYKQERVDPIEQQLLHDWISQASIHCETETWPVCRTGSVRSSFKWVLCCCLQEAPAQVQPHLRWMADNVHRKHCSVQDCRFCPGPDIHLPHPPPAPSPRCNCRIFG